jgi:prepilin signal peptidase PulO-like enzyme (type II secretory pathway)
MMIVSVFLGAIGLALGSFVGAFTWRLHENKDFVSDRSECEHCHHKLGVLDLVPLLSWITLGGKCRYCRASIGRSAPLLELAMAALFVGSYLVWPLPFDTWQAYVSFGLWLVYLVGLMALLVYDLRWMLLPNVVIFPLIGAAVLESVVRYSLTGEGAVGYLTTTVYGILVLGGLYWALYTFSKGKWIGYGDVKLGVFMGIALGFQRSLLALFLANIVGFVVLLPGLMTGKLTRHSRVPFGPFMIIAFMLAFLFGDSIIDWYLHFILVK